MAKDKTAILADIESYIGKHGGKVTEWYIGTATDPKAMLFRRHKLQPNDVGLVRSAKSETEAADIVSKLVNDRKMKGDSKPVIEPGRRHLYLYKCQPHTKP